MELNHVRLEDLPHKLREDDVYRGYHLEKDSLVMVNIWCVLSPSPRLLCMPLKDQPESPLSV